MLISGMIDRWQAIVTIELLPTTIKDGARVPAMLNHDQIMFYEENGYLVIEDAVEPCKVRT